MLEIVGQIIEFLKNLSPIIMIIVGVLLFVFAGAAKWLIKLVGIGLVVYGVLTVFGFVIPPPTENIENVLGLISCLAL